MKQFVKALNGDGICFRYLCSTFLGVSTEKIEAGTFNGPQIRQLIKDLLFDSQMKEKERAAWTAFVLVIKNFLGNCKASNCIEQHDQQIQRSWWQHISIKFSYFHSYLNHFRKILMTLVRNSVKGGVT